MPFHVHVFTTKIYEAITVARAESIVLKKNSLFQTNISTSMLFCCDYLRRQKKKKLSMIQSVDFDFEIFFFSFF